MQQARDWYLSGRTDLSQFLERMQSIVASPEQFTLPENITLRGMLREGASVARNL